MSSLVGGVTHPAFAAVDAVNAGLDELAEASVWALPTAELAALVVAVEKVGRRVAAAQMSVLAQAEGACVRALTGARTTPLWLRSAADVPVWKGRQRLGLARQLAGRPLVAEALASGVVSEEAALAVCAAVASLPGGCRLLRWGRWSGS